MNPQARPPGANGPAGHQHYLLAVAHQLRHLRGEVLQLRVIHRPGGVVTTVEPNLVTRRGACLRPARVERIIGTLRGF